MTSTESGNRAVVTRVAEFGTFVELEPGVTGLVPSSESGVARESSLAKALPVGTTLEVVVLDLDAASRRMRLGRTAIVDAREAEEVRECAERTEAAPSEAFGSLADTLRGAIKPRT
jgi:ribosomal protein S1